MLQQQAARLRQRHRPLKSSGRTSRQSPIKRRIIIVRERGARANFRFRPLALGHQDCHVRRCVGSCFVRGDEASSVAFPIAHGFDRTVVDANNPIERAGPSVVGPLLHGHALIREHRSRTPWTIRRHHPAELQHRDADALAMDRLAALLEQRDGRVTFAHERPVATQGLGGFNGRNMDGQKRRREPAGRAEMSRCRRLGRSAVHADHQERDAMPPLYRLSVAACVLGRSASANAAGLTPGPCPHHPDRDTTPSATFAATPAVTAVTKLPQHRSAAVTIHGQPFSVAWLVRS